MRCCTRRRRCTCYGCAVGGHCDPRPRPWWRRLVELWA